MTGPDWLRNRPDWRALAKRLWPTDELRGDGPFGLRHELVAVPWRGPAGVTELFESAEAASLAEADASLHSLTYFELHDGPCPVAACARHTLVTLTGEGEAA